jgi:hypothetical protein
VDLTFATHLATSARSECQIQNSTSRDLKILRDIRTQKDTVEVFGGEYPGGAPLYSDTGRMDPKGAQAVLDVFSQSVPEVANAKIDLSKTYTNRFVEQALTTTGMLSR